MKKLWRKKEKENEKKKKKERIKKRTHKKGKENKEIQREESVLKKKNIQQNSKFSLFVFYSLKRSKGIKKNLITRNKNERKYNEKEKKDQV